MQTFSAILGTGKWKAGTQRGIITSLPDLQKWKGPLIIKFWWRGGAMWTLTLKTITLENTLPFFSKCEGVYTQ